MSDTVAGRFELMGLLDRGNMGAVHERTDAEITLGIYQRHPVLVRDADAQNPWGLPFRQGLFSMATDSNLFLPPESLADAEFDGWSYHRDGTEYVPLYEATMLGHYDHRFATYRDAAQAQINKGTLPRPTDSQHDDPDMEPLARYWARSTAASSPARWRRRRPGGACWSRPPGSPQAVNGRRASTAACS